MKNTTAIIGIGAIIIVAAVFLFTNSSGATVTENNLVPSENVQVVKLSVQGGNYVMSPSTMKKGVPVRLEADMANLPGCSRSIVISSFGVMKTLSEGNNVIEFTPDKAGTFNIACSMNMYRGTFTVSESDGSQPVYVEQQLVQPTREGSCGMGGGCGCGVAA